MKSQTLLNLIGYLFPWAASMHTYSNNSLSSLSFEKLILTENQSKKLLNGVFDEVYELSDGLYRVYAVDQFWGVGEVENKKLKMKSYVRDL